MSAHKSLRQILREAAAEIGGADGATDVQVLAAHAFATSHAGLIADAARIPDESAVRNFAALVARRVAGEPVAYILGRWEFWSLELEVGPAVLIPRPETELLVELALERIPRGTPARVADLGTGSGAIALAIAKERPEAVVHAVDASVEALEIARRNAERLRLANVRFHHGDWLAPLTGEHLDLVASNPPYVAETDPHLARGDCRFEPRGALASGPEGMDAIRRIAAAAPRYLAEGGWLLLEHGHEQGASARATLEANGFFDVFTARDLEHRERVSGGTQPAKQVT